MLEATGEKIITLVNFLRILFPPELIAATLIVSLAVIFLLYKRGLKE